MKIFKLQNILRFGSWDFSRKLFNKFECEEAIFEFKSPGNRNVYFNDNLNIFPDLSCISEVNEIYNL